MSNESSPNYHWFYFRWEVLEKLFFQAGFEQERLAIRIIQVDSIWSASSVRWWPGEKLALIGKSKKVKPTKTSGDGTNNRTVCHSTDKASQLTSSKRKTRLLQARIHLVWLGIWVYLGFANCRTGLSSSTSILKTIGLESVVLFIIQAVKFAYSLESSTY